MQKTEVGVGVGLIALSGWVFWYAETYARATIYFYGPNFFPQVLSVIMAGCAGILIFNGARGKALAPCDSIHFKGFLRMLAAMVMCIGYLLLMQVLGFAISTMIFLFTLMTFLKHKKILTRILASVVTAMIVWSIFTYFLIIPLPTGMFEFTF